MTSPEFVLASASPRRRRLIEWLLGPHVRSIATDLAEELDGPLSPAGLATSLAARKAAVARQAGETGTILAFDTIVVLDGRTLGKPADEDAARSMLRALSGRSHEVITGVAILPAADNRPRLFSVSTPVRMQALDEASIESWLAEGEALGCAGAYNIERHLASVDEGECFQNVAGLPLCHVYRELASGRAGVLPEGLIPPVSQCEAALGRRCSLGRTVCGLRDQAGDER